MSARRIYEEHINFCTFFPGTVEEEKETEEDTLPTFVLPEYVELPSEGADLSSLPQNRIAELVNKITLLVCRRIQQLVLLIYCMSK